MNPGLKHRQWRLVLGGAGLLFLAYPPFHLLLPSFIALVPLVWLLEEAAHGPSPGRRAAVVGFWAGLVANGALLYWVAVALAHFSPLAVPAYLAAVLIMAAWWSLLSWGVVTLWLRLPRVPRWLTFAVCWVMLEWCMGHAGDLEIPWLGLGTSLTGYPILVQWADLAGARGVSLWLAALNVLLARLLVSPAAARRELLGVLSTILLALGYGLYREATLETRFLGGVALIQPNSPYHQKWSEAEQDRSLGDIEAQTRRAIASIQPDLVIWPEAAVPGFLSRHPEWSTRLADLDRWARAPLLVGGLAEEDGRVYNAGFLYDRNNGLQPETVYRKRHLVPIVEQVPFLPAGWRSSGGFFGSYSRGDSALVQHIPMGAFGVTICFESAFPEVARQYRREGAEFLVNLTNDAWYDHTTAPYQHAAHLIMRAIETRMGIARAANSGISEVVSPFGVPRGQTPLHSQVSVVVGLETTDLIPLYVRWGDWVGVLSLVTLAGMTISAWRR